MNHLPITSVFGATALAGLALLQTSGTAIAALWLVLDRDSGPPGTA